MLTQAGKTILMTAAVVLQSKVDPYLSLLFSATGEDLCKQVQTNSPQKSTNYLTVAAAVGEAGGNGDAGAPTAPGTYSNTDGALIFSTGDSSDCLNKRSTTNFQDHAVVTLTDVGSATSPTQGSLQITLRDGSTISGSFSASSCTLPDQSSSQSATCH